VFDELLVDDVMYDCVYDELVMFEEKYFELVMFDLLI